MSKIQLVSGPPGPIGQATVVRPPDTSAVFTDVGGSIDTIRAEIDDAFADMKTFVNRQPDEIMRTCSGHSARLAEIRVRIQRIEDFHRQWKPVRVREIEPALDQLMTQFQIASRLHAFQELEFKMSGGQT